MTFSASISALVESSDNPLVAKADRWRRIPIGELAKIVNGFPFKSEFFGEDGVPLIRIRDVTAGQAKTKYRGPVPDGYWVSPGDIVIGMDGDFNCRVWAGDRALLNQRVCKVVPKTGKIDPGFLAYLLPGYLGLINQETHSITVKHLSSKTISEIPLPYPDLEEQRRIVAKLDSLLGRSKNARDELDHIPKLVARYKQAVLAAAFRGDLTADWRELNNMQCPTIAIRTPVDRRVGELSELPSSWAWRAVGDITAVAGGLTKNPSRQSLPMKMPYLRVANVYANELRLDQVEEIGVTPVEASRVSLKAGDLLIVEGNGSIDQIGRVALWRGEIADCGHQNHIIRASPLPEIAPKFILYWLLSPAGRAAIEIVASSSSGLHTLSISKVRGLPIPICAEVEMAVVVEQIERHFAVLETTVERLSRTTGFLGRLDQALLAKAFRGELVLQDTLRPSVTTMAAE